MDHNDIRHKLSEYLDNAVSSSEKAVIEKHLESCAECSAALTELRKTIEHVKTIEEMESPAWMTQKIMARVREEAGRKKSIWQWLFFPLRLKLPIQAVAVAFLAVTAFYIYQSVHPAMQYAKIPMEGFSAKPETPTVAMNEPPARAQKPAPAAKTPAPVIARSEALKQSKKYAMESEAQADKLAAAPAAPAAPAASDERFVTEQGDTATARKREEAKPFAGLVARDEAVQEAPATAPKAKAMAFAEKEEEIHLTVEVKNVEGASKEIEKIITQLNGKIIKTERAEGKESHTAKFDAIKLKELFDKLKSVGELRTKEVPSATREGQLRIKIEIVMTSAGQ
jgi:anti-sigma factor RsiW